VDNYSKGRLLVTIQFILLGGLVFISSPDIFANNSTINNFGGVLELLGFAVVILGFFGLGKSLTANPVPLKQAKLITKGIYSRVRHPIYFGLILATLGMTLSSGSQIKFVFWVLLVSLFLFKIKFEEAMLLRTYPEYQKYMDKVPGLIPNLVLKRSK
jgi:protein-S-isoprenylcysteine O-methyltransferase Ste14